MQFKSNEVALSGGFIIPATQRCSICNSDLSITGLDLNSAAHQDALLSTGLSRCEETKHNCALCRMIVAVVRHIEETFHCNFDYSYFELNTTAGGYYLLCLSVVKMPPPSQQSDEGTKFGKIAIYLRGRSSCILSDVSNGRSRARGAYPSKDLRTHRPPCMCGPGARLAVNLQEWTTNVMSHMTHAGRLDYFTFGAIPSSSCCNQNIRSRHHTLCLVTVGATHNLSGLSQRTSQVSSREFL